MKISLFAVVLACLFTTQLVAQDKPATAAKEKANAMLQHVAAFKFKADASEQQIAAVVKAFEALPGKIPQIKKFQAGVNNSPEGLNKGFTHGWIISFKTEKDRETYLVHPDHKAFAGSLKPVLEDAFVIDFWGQD